MRIWMSGPKWPSGFSWIFEGALLVLTTQTVNFEISVLGNLEFRIFMICSAYYAVLINNVVYTLCCAKVIGFFQRVSLQRLRKCVRQTLAYGQTHIHIASTVTLAAHKH